MPVLNKQKKDENISQKCLLCCTKLLLLTLVDTYAIVGRRNTMDEHELIPAKARTSKDMDETLNSGA